jgi:hypothetical protein
MVQTQAMRVLPGPVFTAREPDPACVAPYAGPACVARDPGPACVVPRAGPACMVR